MVQEDEGEEKKEGQVVIYMVDRRQIQGTRRRETERYKKTFISIFDLGARVWDTMRDDMWAVFRHAGPAQPPISLYTCVFHLTARSRGGKVGVR